VTHKKEKQGLCDRFRDIEEDYRDHAVRHAYRFSHEHTDELMYKGEKMMTNHGSQVPCSNIRRHRADQSSGSRALSSGAV
jgi:hypothetical protein